MCVPDTAPPEQPARYWSKRVELGDSGAFATIISLDTNPCISDYRSENGVCLTGTSAVCPAARRAD